MVRGYIIALFLILVRKQNFLLWVSKFDIAAAAAAGKSLQSCLTLCDPIDGSPPRLPRPWDSPGKNTGVGCHFLLQCMKVKSESEVAQSCLTLSDPMDCSLPGSSIHGIFQAGVLEWGAIAFSGTLVRLTVLWWQRAVFPVLHRESHEWDVTCQWALQPAFIFTPSLSSPFKHFREVASYMASEVRAAD